MYSVNDRSRRLAFAAFTSSSVGKDALKLVKSLVSEAVEVNDFGRNVRNIVAEPEFGQIFPQVSLAPDSQAANRMNTNKGGAYVAAGVGTAVTGRGAHIALIDDPFKDREEADSERRREAQAAIGVASDRNRTAKACPLE